MKIDSKNIKRFAASVALAAIVGTPVGLVVNCRRTNHIEEKCAIAKIMDILPPKKIVLTDSTDDKKDDGTIQEQNDTTTASFSNDKICLISRSSSHMANEMYREYGKTDEDFVFISAERITYPVYFEKKMSRYTTGYKVDDKFEGEYGLVTHFTDGTTKSLVLVKDKNYRYK